MADFGKSIVDDCNSMCKGNSKNIVTCWNLFQSAVACHNLGRNKEKEGKNAVLDKKCRIAILKGKFFSFEIE